MTTPPTTPGGNVPAVPKPKDLILVKGKPQQGDGKTIFGIWPSGLVRQITAAEYTLWGSPAIDYVTSTDAEYLQLFFYDKALRREKD
ncbi:hypothetical protein ACFWIB_15165 [Streptomyces sp. NPDC127051]|uniref:hypothetical protein n=1 Tax=Streptomyces sp. NPDC127051 TaxID=3347119 RepID=UPI00365390F2